MDGVELHVGVRSLQPSTGTCSRKKPQLAATFTGLNWTAFVGEPKDRLAGPGCFLGRLFTIVWCPQ